MLASQFALVTECTRRDGFCLSTASLQGPRLLPLTVLEVCSATGRTSLASLLDEPAVSCQTGVSLLEQSNLSLPGACKFSAVASENSLRLSKPVLRTDVNVEL